MAFCVASCERIDDRSQEVHKDVPTAEPRQVSRAAVEDELGRIDRRLDCTRRVRLHDDLWFWDSAVGLECEIGAGRTVRAFVYRTAGSASVAAREQGLADGDVAIVGDRLLVTGHAATLRRLARASVDLPAPVTGEVEAEAMGPAEEDATFCVRAVSAHAMLTIEGGREPRDDIADLDALYPGYADVVTDVDREIVRRGLVRRWRDDQLSLERALSRLGPRIKRFCTPNGDSR